MRNARKYRKLKVRGPHIAVLAILAIATVSVAALVVIPAASPATGAEVADMLRGIVGVQPVAQIESISDQLRDDLNRTRFAGVTARPQISWSSGNHPVAAPQSTATPSTNTDSAKVGPLAPSTNVVSAPPDLAWQAYGPTQDGIPLMARTLILVDPQRSYAGVALVRIDLNRTRLNIMPGTIEPAHPSGIGKAIPDLGTVPPADTAGLVAAFNGGFKAVHGHYGMMANGITLLPPIDGMGTIAIYKDGSVQMGAWSRDLSPSPDMVAFRQNCPLLVDAGELNPALGTNANRAWGFTQNTDITWRTAIGLSQDRHYLIYAVGNWTDVRFLAQALQQAGAYWGMQLDINQYYAQFMAYSHANGTLTGQRLLDQMTNKPSMYITPNIRDFFYLTVR